MTDKAIRKAVLAALRKMRSDKQSVRDQGLLEIDRIGPDGWLALRRYIEEERFCREAALALVYLWTRTNHASVKVAIEDVMERGGDFAVGALTIVMQVAIEVAES